MLIDWTQGCIALSNEDMEEVWELTPEWNSQIYILPVEILFKYYRLIPHREKLYHLEPNPKPLRGQSSPI